jgi:hypothetical protein
LSFVSPLVKEKFSKKIEAIEEKATITLIPEETRTTNSYLKYAAIFVLGLGLAGSCHQTKSPQKRCWLKLLFKTSSK